jgi:hypothetical protein
MYKNNFVVVIKSRGKILREKNGCVMLPFGAEYSILLKNLDSKRAVASVSVDGDEVLDNCRIIVPENNSVELKGKMKGNKVKHRFKFIEKTKQISKHRGDRPDDGLVRVEYWFEQDFDPTPWVIPLMSYTYTDKCKFTDSNSYTTNGSNILGSYTNGGLENVTYSYNCSTPHGNDGITVQGSKTNQDFVEGTTWALELSSNVIVLQLRGYNKKGVQVERAVTVKTRFRCPTCGRKSKSSAKWCSNCGTNLEM